MKTLLFFVLLTCSLLMLYPEASVTFHNDNQLMQWGDPWMFNYPPGEAFFRNYQTGNPDWIPIWAFVDMTYATRQQMYGPGIYNPLTSSVLIDYEDFPPLNGIELPGLHYCLTYGERDTNENFKLVSFKHLNTVDTNQPWAIFGEAGDCRIYTGATMYVKFVTEYFNEIFLKLTNACFYTLTSYPAQIGTGEEIYGFGWGTIDPSEGEQEWIDALTNETGQVEFNFDSPSAVVQQYFGLYSSDIKLTPANMYRNVISGYHESLPSILNATSGNDMILTIVSGNYYYVGENLLFDSHYSMVAKFYQQPSGDFPEEIVKTYNHAIWEIGASFNECTSEVLFDLSTIPGIETPDNIRILRRKNGFGSEWIDAEAQIVSYEPLQMQFSGYDITGQYCVGSAGSNNLEMNRPLNMSIAYFSNPEQRVEISWQTIPEALYYNIYTSEISYGNWSYLGQVQHPISTFIVPINSTKKFFYVTSTDEPEAME